VGKLLGNLYLTQQIAQQTTKKHEEMNQNEQPVHWRRRNNLPQCTNFVYTSQSVAMYINDAQGCDP